MIIMNIAEWIANLFILGIASLLWVLVVFGAMMAVSILNKMIKESIK
tara:strand:+ start:913 stop:1053 length:141 start_codon:yes stop_codon:yes gene_type:complete